MDRLGRMCGAVLVKLAFTLLGAVAILGASAAHAASDDWALALHGGASGVPKDLSPADLEHIEQTLREALESGARILRAGGSSLDAVQATVRLMESSAVLNAGRGAVLDHQGFAELDAALMDGRTRKAGAVAAVRHVASPIDLARAVMDHSPHVLLVGLGAEQFAQEQGMMLKPDDYFITPRRRRQLEEAIEAAQHPERRTSRSDASSLSGSLLGTVGAVALDRQGHLAAATSTGGLTNKHYGRVGDSPLIGAGTYAEDGVCAVSATGVGEYFIRYTAAADVCARIKYRSEHLERAAREVIDELKSAGGEGGLIAIDAHGTITQPFSTASMLRGQVSSTHSLEIVSYPRAPR